MSEASIIPEFVSRKSLIELEGRTRAERLFDEGTWKEVVGSFDGMESPWLLLQGIAPQADDGCIVIEETIGGMPAVAVALEGAFHVETQYCGLSLEEYARGYRTGPRAIACEPSASSRPLGDF